METNRCKYCGRTYSVEPYHTTEGLTRYCSHGCRLSELGLDHYNTSHGGKVEVVLNGPEDPAASELYANIDGARCYALEKDPVFYQHPSESERFMIRMAYYVRRIVKVLLTIDAVERETVLRRLNGESWASVAMNASIMMRKTITEKSAQKALAAAVRNNPWMVPLFKSTVEKQKRHNQTERNEK